MAKKNLKKAIISDGVAFDKEFLESFSTFEDFSKAMEDKTYAHLFEGANRHGKLRSAYNLVKPKQETEETQIDETQDTSVGTDEVIDETVDTGEIAAEAPAPKTTRKTRG